MHLRTLTWLPALSLAITLALAGPGCTFGDTNTPEDGGVDAPDAATDDGDSAQADNAEPEPLVYPPGPYGTHLDETVANLAMEEAICDGDQNTGTRPWKLEDFLGAGAVMISVHAGWCSVCKTQSESLMADVVNPYDDQGLKIAMVIFEDASHASDRASLLAYVCGYKSHYGFNFPMLIDPDVEVMAPYFRPTEAGTPLNMLLDRDMVIRYKVEGLIPDSRVIQGNIEALLSE
ncbi:MAG TPA: redoxin domain-containing protein [Myxococcota bacterium]|nr:redoxin domain-containing protein [Myxococcota bacterium]HRY92326.1 redoxin domain-containing protein [Myxococcota bacterium]HSA21654.1 redoxin domain-containing protein [Myxococcota bacterium]